MYPGEVHIPDPRSNSRFSDRYRLLNEIGRGGMSVIYRAEDRLNGQHVAIKRVFLRDESPRNDPNVTTPAQLLALTQEFRVLASLRHPYIIQVYDYGFDGGLPYLAIELVDSPRTLTEAGRGQPPELQAALLIQLLEALAYLHRRRIVHHDLKPSNVLVTPENRVKVLDFGLSGDEKQSSTPEGTLIYMAPETLRSGTATYQSDLYSVGVMAYEMIAGRVPFNVYNLIGVLTQPPDPKPIAGHPFELIIQRLLLKEAEDRYANPREVIAALQAAIGIQSRTQDRDVRESFLQAAAFIGRYDELQTLMNAIKTVKVSTGDEPENNFLISGESGVGKSRLVDEAAVYALTDGFMVLRGEAREDGGLPFQVWRSIVRRLALSISMSDDEAQTLAAIVPDIGTLTHREIAPVGMPKTAEAQQLLVNTILDVIRRIDFPALIIAEDLQWAHESLIVLQRLIQQMPPQVLIIGTYRSDETRSLGSMLQPMHIIKLERLNDAAVNTLVNSMIGVRPNPQVYELVKRETGGNTFFIVEVVRALAEAAGELDRIGVMTLPKHVFTGGMRRLLTDRLEKLGGRWLELLRIAAVAGKRIDTALMQATMTDPALLDDWLFACEDASVFTVKDSAWVFVHDQMRQAVLDAIPVSDVPRYHERVAEAIESVYAGDAAYEELLLIHWSSAKRPEKAMSYLDPVIMNMLDITAQYTRASELLESVKDVLTNTLNQKLQVARLRSRVRWRLSNYAESIRIAKEALALALEMDEHVIAADLYSLIGNSLLDIGAFEEAEDYYQKSLLLAIRLKDLRRVAIAANNHANTELHLGRAANAIHYLKTTLAIDLRLGGAKRSIAMSLNNMGQSYKVLGNFAVSHAMHQRSMALYQSIGDQRGVASNCKQLGALYEAEGNYDQAEAYYAKSLRIYQMIGAQQGAHRVLANWGHLHITVGQIEEAIPMLVQSLRYTYMNNQYSLMDRALMGFARILLARGDSARALETLRYCLRRCATDPESSYHIPLIMEDLRRRGLVLPPLTLEDSAARRALIDVMIAEFGEQKKLTASASC